jgi:hypothetical protein
VLRIYHHRWSGLTRRHLHHHPHHHHPRARAPGVSSSSTSRTGAEPPSYQISYRRRRRHGVKSSLVSSDTLHLHVPPVRVGRHGWHPSGPTVRFDARFDSSVYCLSSLPFLISSHTYRRVCRIIFIGHYTVIAGPAQAFVIPLLYTIVSFFLQPCGVYRKHCQHESAFVRRNLKETRTLPQI